MSIVTAEADWSATSEIAKKRMSEATNVSLEKVRERLHRHKATADTAAIRETKSFIAMTFWSRFQSCPDAGQAFSNATSARNAGHGFRANPQFRAWDAVGRRFKKVPLPRRFFGCHDRRVSDRARR